MSEEKQIEARGGRCYAIGIDAKVIASGVCNHPNKRTVDERAIKDSIELRRPIPEHKWTHCIFMCRNGECIFAGECEHRREYEQGKAD